MRILCTFIDQKKGQTLSTYLTQAGIDNQLEITSNNDWGSSDYGNIKSTIWITEEDQVAQAHEILEKFEENPNDPQFHPHEIISTLLEPIHKIQGTSFIKKEVQIPLAEVYPTGRTTISIIAICTFLLLVNYLTTPGYVENIAQTVPYTPLFTSPIYKMLMYDYPQAYEWVDKFVNAYGIEALQNLNDLDPAQKALLKHASTPQWKGFYEIAVNHFKNFSLPWTLNAPLFEKIRQGQIWRIFTPALLHYDIFHLFFNMIWLLALGKQMEKKLGIGRYLFFILLTGAISNTLQYLTGGPNFLGFSGILCGMLTFVWIRQRNAGWEGYQMQSATFGFIAIFILGMFAIQFLSFVLEIYSNIKIAPGIANTAHITGGITGIICGKLNFFSIKNR